MTQSGRIAPSHLVAILGFDGVQPIDVSGPAQAFATANVEGAVPPYAIHVVGVKPGTVKTTSGFGITVEAAPRSGVGTLIVPGGPGIHNVRTDPAWLALMAALAAESRRICSVCTGAFLLAAAGMLDGRRAATHWHSSDLLASEYPAVLVDPGPIFIEDGICWTSAGVTAGIDLTLALIERDHGTALALRVARRLVVPLRRPGGQKQLSEMLALQTKVAMPFEALLKAISADPARNWSMEAMAAAVGQSERNFHRRFSAAMQCTPSQAIERIRAEMAHTLLQSTGLRITEIAARSGFRTETTMRRTIVRHYGKPG